MGQIVHYAKANDLLTLLQTQLTELLGEQFVGLYLYGSLASGDFNPASSDIDFVVVTRGKLAPQTVAALEQMHQALWASGSKWAAKLEGSYIPLDDLRQYDHKGGPFPQVNEGRFFVSGHGPDWIIQRYMLREHGAAVSGPPLKPFIDPVAPEQLRQAARGVLNDWWAGVLDNPAWLERRDYQAYATLTMCRARYMLQHGAIIAKPAAVTWALANLDGRWRPLIQRASQWPTPPQPDELAETLAFIRETLAISRTPPED
jgi:hypothetical protein